MKSRSEIWYSLIDEIGEACSVSTTRDKTTVAKRVAAEGDAFFTIALPAFEKDLLRSLDEGFIHTDAFHGWSRKKFTDSVSGKTYRGVPEFLGGFLDQLFYTRYSILDDGSGKLIYEHLYEPILVNVDTTDLFEVNRVAMIVKGLRQLLLLFSKEKNLCDESKIRNAIEGYIQTDDELMLPLRTRARILSLRVVFAERFGE